MTAGELLWFTTLAVLGVAASLWWLRKLLQRGGKRGSDWMDLAPDQRARVVLRRIHNTYGTKVMHELIAYIKKEK